VIVKINEPAVVGIPEITPVELNPRPGGRVLGGTLKLKDPLPPVAVMTWLYALLPMPAGKLVGESVIGCGLMVME
jgi:hypothetical protein